MSKEEEETMKFKVYDIENESIINPKTGPLEEYEYCEVEASLSGEAASMWLSEAVAQWEDGMIGQILTVSPEGLRRVFSFHYEIRVRYNLRPMS